MKSIRLQALAEAPAAFGSTLEREQAFTEQTWRERVTTNLAFLAWLNGAVVGTATGYRDPEKGAAEVQLVAMYVAPAARGTGCAFALIDAVAGAARLEGRSRLVLDVTDANSVAARCYHRYGFVETGRVKPLGRAPQLMEIELALDLV